MYWYMNSAYTCITLWVFTTSTLLAAICKKMRFIIAVCRQGGEVFVGWEAKREKKERLQVGCVSVPQASTSVELQGPGTGELFMVLSLQPTACIFNVSLSLSKIHMHM